MIGEEPDMKIMIGLVSNAKNQTLVAIPNVENATV